MMSGGFGADWLKYFNFLLILISVVLIIELALKSFVQRKVPEEALILTRQIQKTGLNYSLLNKYLRLTQNYRTDIDSKYTLSQIVDKLPVSEKCKKYFTENIQIAENMEYNESSKEYNRKFVKKHFDELNSKIVG